MEFHQRLKQLRTERNVTQLKLGAVLNYGSSAIANYESGRNQPSIPDLKKIAHYFGVSLDYLLGDADIPKALEPPLTPKELDFMCTILAKRYILSEIGLESIFRPIMRNIAKEYANSNKKCD